MKNIIWRSRASILLAIIVMILPFLRLPQSFKNTLFVILGLLIALFSFARSHYAAGYETEQREYEIKKTETEPGEVESMIEENDNKIS